MNQAPYLQLWAITRQLDAMRSQHWLTPDEVQQLYKAETIIYAIVKRRINNIQAIAYEPLADQTDWDRHRA